MNAISTPLIDSQALVDDLDALLDEYGAGSSKLRPELLGRLKVALSAGRDAAREQLEAGQSGIACAEDICGLLDVMIDVLYGFIHTNVYPMLNPTQAERLSVVAVGGYGRGSLAPGSDVDLLFVLPYKQTPWGESVVEYILYILWDLGLKVGHATRSVDQSVALAKSDHTIRTAILEARYLCGDRALYEELKQRFGEDVVAGTGRQFVDAKLAEQDERHRRAGESRYLVEPNVKDGKGGLRDLHTLFWIAKYTYRVEDSAELVKLGVFTSDEYQHFLKAEDFLWTVRCHLHFMAGRGEEKLTFDRQPELAKRLGFSESDGLSDVERFMKRYFLVAKDVGDLTRIFCAALEEQHKKRPPRLGRLLPRFSLGRWRAGPPVHGFNMDGNRLTIENDKVFKKDPINLIRLFHLAETHELDIHPDALKLVTRSLHLIDDGLCNDEDANALFLEILTSPKQPETALRRMNEAGVLGLFLPDFGRIVALMQFNMYHHYTVDEHLLRAVGVLSDIERGKRPDEHPLSNEIFSKIRHRRALYVAVLLHDIAKGRPEDHSKAAAMIAHELGPRLGLNKAEVEHVSWLVGNHLLMSEIAQQRDLSDSKAIQDFAKEVQTAERLRLVMVLTAADITAVGPGVWNNWKGQLLRQLYFETESILAGGHSRVTREGSVAARKLELTARLADWPAAQREGYLERHYDPYWLALDTDSHERHARAISEIKEVEAELNIVATPNALDGITEILVFAPDHPGLFSRLAGACAISGANIVDAKVFTTRDGMALDMFYLQDELGKPFDEARRIETLRRTMERTLTGEIRAPEAFAESKAPRRQQAFRVEPEVVIDNSASDNFTVIEVTGLDRPGLLHDVTRALFHASLSVASAHITTYGERAVDVFYVKDLMGTKVVRQERLDSIEALLLKGLRADDADDTSDAPTGLVDAAARS